MKRRNRDILSIPIGFTRFMNVLGAAVLLGFTLAEMMVAQSVASPHDAEIFGVKIGMDVPTALRMVWENANHSQPGKEKPDAKKNEGEDNKDVRVLYKLKEGNLHIVFVDAKVVKEILFEYAKPLRYEDLRLPHTSWIGAAVRGERYDDRYSVGYTSEQAREQYWWRDEKMPQGYRIRVGFISDKLGKAGALQNKTIVRKLITVVPEDKEKFAQVLALK